MEGVGSVAMKRALHHALGTSHALGLSERILEKIKDRDKNELLVKILQEFVDNLQEEEIETLENNTPTSTGP